MSNSRSSACIAQERLSRYLKEQIDESEEAVLQEHLSHCSECQQQLERIAASRAMWDAFTHSEPSSEEQQDPTLQALADYLSPTEDPQFLGRVGGYEVSGIIGQGSTGIVLKAMDRRLSRFVAIKVLTPALVSSGPARRRFEREGRAIAAVSHEHVVPIYAVDEHRGLPYIVMQYVPGLSLLQRIEKKGTLSTCEVVRVGVQIASGLAAAHEQGIIHRDVKPGNVLLEETVERAMVTDFGLAQVADDATMTRTGTISGTPQYMSPEQARGESVDVRTDLFSLGSLLYAACTARAPFRAETVFGIIHRVCETKPRPIPEINPEIAPWLVQFIEKLMAKKPSERFDSAADVVELLSAELAHLQAPSAHREPRRDWLLDRQATTQPASQTGASPSRTWASPSRWGVALLVTAALAFGGFLIRGQLLPPDKQDSRPQSSGTVLPSETDPAVVSGEQQDSGDSEALLADRPTTQVADGSDSRPADPGDQAGRKQDAVASRDTPVIQGYAGLAPEEGVRVTWAPSKQQVNSITQRLVQRLEQSFVVPDSGEITLEVDYGNIEVRQTELDYASFVVVRTIEAGSQTEANKIASFHSIQWDEASATGTAKFDEKFLARDGIEKFNQIVFGLSVPIDTRVEVKTQEGTILVGALAGDVSAEARGGDIHFGKVHGSMYARAVGGEIVATDGCVGALDLMATHGNVCVAGVDGRARLRASDGNIYVGDNPGTVSAHATGGDVCIAAVSGPVRAHVEDGNIRAELASEPISDLVLSTAAGDIRLQTVTTTQASLRALGNIEGNLDWQLEDLASDGEVGAQAGLESAPKEQWYVSELNEGGSLIQLTATSGTVSVYANGETSEERSGLGGSGNAYFSLGGSGNHAARAKASVSALAKTSGEPRAGAMVPVPVQDGGNIDGYTLYLPVNYDNTDQDYPILLYLQGAYGVGGPITNLNDWGLPRLIRDENDTSSERNRLLLDSFIVVSIHIQRGSYDDYPEVVERILQDVGAAYRTDQQRYYVTGVSRGGHACYDLIGKMPGVFAATVPVGGEPSINDFEAFKGTSVWIAHNRQDSTVEWSGADSAAKQIETRVGQSFLRIPNAIPAEEQIESAKYVFTEPDIQRHDAWTDLYCSEQFYRWLLRQSRTELD